MSRLLPITLAVLPLVIAPGLSLHYDVIPRLVVFEILVCALLACTPVWLPGISIAWDSFSGRMFVLLVGAATIWSAVCTFTSADRTMSIYGSTWRESGLITWAAILAFAVVTLGTIVRNPELIKTILRAIALSGIVGSCYGILQYFGIDPFIPSAGYHAGEGVFTIVRTPGTLGHADYFASWLVVVFFFAWALRSRESGIWKYVGWAAQCTCAAAIVLSGTRAAIVALLIGAVVAVAMKRPRIRLPQVAAFITPVLLGVLFYISPLGAQLRARVHWSVDDTRGGARLLLWRDSLRMAADRPLLGFGPETYSVQFPKFQSVALARQYPDWYHESPHNTLLDAAVSEGLPGLLLTLALFGLGIGAAWSARGKEPALSAALLAAVTAQFVNLQFVAMTLTGAVFLLVTVALSVSLMISRQRDEYAVPRWSWVPAFAVTLVLLTLSVRLCSADIQLARFDRAIQGGHTDAAIAAYQKAQRWSPSGRTADLYCSRRLFSAMAGERDVVQRLQVAHAAITAAVRATETADDRQNAWYNLAMLAAFENDRAGVERCLRQAISASPNWFRPHWALARLLQGQGRNEEARAEAATAVDLNGGHDPRLSATLAGSALEPVIAR